MSEITKKEKLNVIMEAKGYEYIPWNDERNSSGGAGYYIKKDKDGLPTIGGKILEVSKLHHKNPILDWHFVMSNSISLGCKIDSTKQDTVEKAFDKLYKFYYKKLNKSPENQLDLFEKKTCACGKNPECECKKE